MYATSAPASQSNGVDLRLKSVDSFILSGLQERFLSLFNCPCVWTTSTDKVKALERLFPDSGTKNGKSHVTYPYAFLIPASFNTAMDRGSLRSASLRGTRVVVGDDNISNLSVRFLPVDISVRVEFISNSIDTCLDFSRRWLFAAVQKSLSFQVQYGETTFNIKIEADPNVNIPSRQADPDNVQEYDPMEVSLVVQGFISETEPIRTQNALVAEIDVTTEAAATTGATTWAFRSR